MATYRNPGSNHWRYRKTITLPDGTKTRVTGTPAVNTKAAAEAAEREHVARVLIEGPRVGRPRDTEEARTITITVRVSPSEEERLLALMEAHGYESVSELLRAAAFKLGGNGGR